MSLAWVAFVALKLRHFHIERARAHKTDPAVVANALFEARKYNALARRAEQTARLQRGF